MWSSFRGSQENLLVSDFPGDIGFPARAVHPLLRVLKLGALGSKDLGLAVIETLCVCAKVLGWRKWIQLFDEVTKCSIRDWENFLLNQLRSESSQAVQQ